MDRVSPPVPHPFSLQIELILKWSCFGHVLVTAVVDQRPKCVGQHFYNSTEYGILFQRDIGAPVVLNGILWGIISSWKSEDCEVDQSPSFVSLVAAVEINSWIHSTIHQHRWTKKHTVDYEDNFI